MASLRTLKHSRLRVAHAVQGCRMDADKCLQQMRFMEVPLRAAIPIQVKGTLLYRSAA
jgi:hypothetical protein